MVVVWGRPPKELPGQQGHSGPIITDSPTPRADDNPLRPEAPANDCARGRPLTEQVGYFSHHTPVPPTLI